MGATIVTGGFTLAGVILGFALDWLRASAERRRADARELADLIAQLRDTAGTLRGFGRVLHGFSEAMPGDAPASGLVKAALETTSSPMDAITALTRLVTERAGFRLVLEQRNGHLNDRARTNWRQSMIIVTRADGSVSGTSDTAQNSRLEPRPASLRPVCIAGRTGDAWQGRLQTACQARERPGPAV